MRRPFFVPNHLPYIPTIRAAGAFSRTPRKHSAGKVIAFPVARTNENGGPRAAAGSRQTGEVAHTAVPTLSEALAASMFTPSRSL